MPLFFLLSGRLLIKSDGTSRASGSASTTLDAFIGIDFVDVAFGNSSDRAFASTCTTCYARIRNFVSHSLINLIVYGCKNTTFFRIGA